MKYRIGIIVLLLAGLVSLPLAAQPTAGGEAQNKTTQASHFGTGKVMAIYRDKSAIRISHEPIKSLNWRAMPMAFNVVKASLLDGIKVGDTVQFELGKPRPEDKLWVIVKIERK